MSHRDDCLISTVEEAKDWLDQYRHTVADQQVLRVIEILESGQSEALQDAERDADSARDELKDAEATLKEFSEKIEKLEELQESILEAAEEWSSYVTEDNAPRTLIDHLRKAIDNHP